MANGHGPVKLNDQIMNRVSVAVGVVGIAVAAVVAIRGQEIVQMKEEIAQLYKSVYEDDLGDLQEKIEMLTATVNEWVGHARENGAALKTHVDIDGHQTMLRDFRAHVEGHP